MGLKMELAGRFLEAPEDSFFLLGPRGTGKSTWLRQSIPAALVVDLLQPETHRTLSARPERLRERIAGSPGVGTVVIDEVQRVPELLTVVHSLIEERSGLRFVLTGSSARKLRRGGIDLLAGRAVVRTMHPFMAAEWPDFELGSALQIGLVPLVVAATDPRDTVAAYASLYLEQEVQLEGWARDVGQFARFLEAVSFSQAASLNVSNVARECEVERKTVAGYLQVLEDLLLAFRLPVFTRRARRQLATHSKFYLFDAGVYRALRPRGPLDRADEIDGAALEGLVAQHLRAWLAYSPEGGSLGYWRTRSGVEVDFVVYTDAALHAIEVKNTARVRPEDLAGLRSFREDYPECQAVLLYRGVEALLIDGIWCLSVDGFLRALRPGRGLLDVSGDASGRRGAPGGGRRPRAE
jgi:predicted AAA+ superfamily ATPase